MINRYNLSKIETALLSMLGEENLSKIQNARIAIGGAGGLGSNVASNLVRSGFVNFVIADYDVVEVSNLNRQFFFEDQLKMPKVEALEANLKRINPNVTLTKHFCEITSDNVMSIFGGCDVFVEAFDNVKSKALFVNGLIGTDKLMVSVSGLAGWDNSDDIKVHRMSPTFYVVGDLKTEVSASAPPISPRVAIAAAKQADIVLSYFLRK